MRKLIERLNEFTEKPLSVEARLTKEDLKKPWTINASQWLIIKGIKDPWIAEISPVQYARMGKSAKAAYDKKRHKEWSDAAKGKQEWRDAVYAAFKAGEFDVSDKDVHPDAKEATRAGKYRENEAAKEARMRKAERENQINDTSELKVGDTVFSVMSRSYVEVLKVNKKSVMISSNYSPKGMKQGPKALQWLSHNDLEKKVTGDA